ncbi:hypothetical protein E2320_017063 [Naja naja]|nr:hypothetical protein E2320_017063 [Naja naja]
MDWKKDWPLKPLHPGLGYPQIPPPEGQLRSPGPTGCWSPPGLSANPARTVLNPKLSASQAGFPLAPLPRALQPSSLRLGELTRGTLSFSNQKYFVFLTHGLEEGLASEASASWTRLSSDSSSRRSAKESRSHRLLESTRTVSESCKGQAGFPLAPLPRALQPSSLRLGELTRGTLSFSNQKYFVFLTHGLEEGLASEASASWTRLSSDSSSRRSAKESRSHRLLESTRTVSESCKGQY